VVFVTSNCAESSDMFVNDVCRLLKLIFFEVGEVVVSVTRYKSSDSAAFDAAVNADNFWSAITV